MARALDGTCAGLGEMGMAWWGSRRRRVLGRRRSGIGRPWASLHDAEEDARLRKQQVVVLHIAQCEASPGAELPQLLLLAKTPASAHSSWSPAAKGGGRGRVPWLAGRGGRRGGVVVEEQGSERMRLDEAYGLS